MTGERFIPQHRQYQGPPRIEDKIHELELDPMTSEVWSKRQEYDRSYGPEGVGWEVRDVLPNTREERLVQNMGLAVLEVMVTPDGDMNALRRRRQSD